MKSKMLPLMCALLIAGCETIHSDPGAKADKITVPAVKAYTHEQYQEAAKEHEKFCLPNSAGQISAPVLCGMLDDFGRMRDQARAAMGLTVDLSR